jgi:hypothetical protein
LGGAAAKAAAPGGDSVWARACSAVAATSCSRRHVGAPTAKIAASANITGASRHDGGWGTQGSAKNSCPEGLSCQKHRVGAKAGKTPHSTAYVLSNGAPAGERLEWHLELRPGLLWQSKRSQKTENTSFNPRGPTRRREARGARGRGASRGWSAWPAAEQREAGGLWAREAAPACACCGRGRGRGRAGGTPCRPGGCGCLRHAGARPAAGGPLSPPGVKGFRPRNLNHVGGLGGHDSRRRLRLLGGCAGGRNGAGRAAARAGGPVAGACRGMARGGCTGHPRGGGVFEAKNG